MCGIAGIVDHNGQAEELVAIIEWMKDSIIHRGPDEEGTYLDPDLKKVILGHRRLTIIDPEHGKQPMTSRDGGVTIVFNGAIYNYLELRRDLITLGHPIHDYSDTEVLLYAYIQWGEACLSKLRGMFSFAIWDRKLRRLFCARDRIGIKPFYYYYDGKKFVFASEIKAILASKLVHAEANLPGIQDYISFQFCLGNKTLFKNIFKLEPGHYLTINLASENLRLQEQCYWDVNYNIDHDHDESYFIDNLAFLLEDSIRQHLRSDVPLGAYLSGGLDSSTVVCYAKSMLGDTPLKTFTGAFSEGKQYDETDYAKLLSQEINTEYHEIFIPSNEFQTILPKLIYQMDEPAAGPGLIPQYYVSRLAANNSVKVVLGGQGGDELYVGYARYLVAYLEKCLYGAINQSSDSKKYAVSLESIVPHLSMLKNYQPMLQNFWQQGLFDSDDKRYFRLIDRSEDSKYLFSEEVFSGYSSFEAYQQIFNKNDLHSLINHMTYFDLKSSLPALLHVEDRTSMAVSLESRVPLLDHRLVEFVATIPPNIKFANGQSKFLFRSAIKNIVPKAILNRTDKMGFPVPLTTWLQKDSYNFVNEILFSDRARNRGLYDIEAIQKSIYSEHEFGRKVWGLLCLELWHRIFIDKAY